MGLDNRIGRKFLHPGPGYGGSCFPKDTRAILETAREHGQELRVISAAVAVNDKRPAQMVEKIRAVAGELKGAVVGMLGLSFKPNTDDLRESASISIAEALRREGATVRAYDPVGMPGAKAQKLDVVFCENEYDAAAGTDVLVLATEWNQFRSLDFERLKKTMKRPLIVDLRNVYDPSEVQARGFRYIGVGR
jgi:UDPglucose 6-dehydrogenase